MLVKLSDKYRVHLCEMMDEWFLENEKIVPYAIRRIDYKEFEKYLQGFEEEERGIPGFVPATNFFGLDTERNIFMSLLPNLAFGIIPYLIALMLPSHSALGAFGAISICMGAGDYFNIFNAATQMPRGARTYLHQFNSFWYMPN